MSPRHRLYLAFTAMLVMALLGTGCYTVLRHPDAEPWSSSAPTDRDQYGYGTNPDYLYGWTDPYYTSLYGGFPPGWGYYYYHPWTPTGPWWYDPWYPWNPWDPADGGIPPVTGGRHAWDRGPGSPASTGPGTWLPGVSGTAPGHGGGTAVPASPAPPAPDTTRRTERRPDPAPAETNPHRNAWGR